MRLPTFSRQSTADNTDDDRTTTVAARRDDRPPISPRRDDTATTTTLPRTESERASSVTADRPVTDRHGGRAAVPVTAPAPKARASFAATLGLILGVAGALLVLSGPLLGWGMGVAGLGLIFSLAGLFTTRKRHVAGKTDALIGLLLSIAALVVGVLALTGQLNWLGTDMQPVDNARQWLDAQFAARF